MLTIKTLQWISSWYDLSDISGIMTFLTCTLKCITVKKMIKRIMSLWHFYCNSLILNDIKIRYKLKIHKHMGESDKRKKYSNIWHEVHYSFSSETPLSLYLVHLWHHQIECLCCQVTIRRIERFMFKNSRFCHIILYVQSDQNRISIIRQIKNSIVKASPIHLFCIYSSQ